MYNVFNTLKDCEGKRKIRMQANFVQDIDRWRIMMYNNNGIQMEVVHPQMNTLFYIDDNTIRF